MDRLEVKALQVSSVNPNSLILSMDSCTAEDSSPKWVMSSSDAFLTALLCICIKSSVDIE